VPGATLARRLVAEHMVRMRAASGSTPVTESKEATA
jgi:hypothetical protein